MSYSIQHSFFPSTELASFKRSKGMLSDPDFEPDSESYTANLRRFLEDGFEAEDSDDDFEVFNDTVAEFAARPTRTAMPEMKVGMIYWPPYVHEIAKNWRGNFNSAFPVDETFLNRKERDAVECVTRFIDPRQIDPVTVST